MIPLILEGNAETAIISAPAAGGQTYPMSANGVITTGRGKLVAISPFISAEGTPGFTGPIQTVEVNGITVLDNVNAKKFYGKYYEKFFGSKLLPLNVPSGSNYNITLTPPKYSGALVNFENSFYILLKLYEGFSIAEVETAELRTKQKGYELFTPSTAGVYTIAETLPKDKGNIKGFEIYYNYNFAPNGQFWADPYNLVTLKIAGIEVVKNVPVQYFAQNIDLFTGSVTTEAVKTFFFDNAIEGGQTFELILNTTNTVQRAEGGIGVNFIFDDVQ